MNIEKLWNTLVFTRVRGQETRDKDRQRGIFCPAHNDLALKAPPSLNQDLIHAPNPPGYLSILCFLSRQ